MGVLYFALSGYTQGFKIDLKIYIRHLYANWLSNFLLVFFIINALLIIAKLVRFEEGGFLLIPLIPALMPGLLGYSLPMATLVGTVITLTRFRQAGHFITLASSGISLSQSVMPLFFIGFFLSGLTFGSGIWVEPWATDFQLRFLEDISARYYLQEIEKPSSHMDFGSVRLHFYTVKEGEKSVLIQKLNHGRIENEFSARHVEVNVDKKARKLVLLLKDVFILNYSNNRVLEASTERYTDELHFDEKFTMPVRYSLMPVQKLWSLLGDDQYKNDYPSIRSFLHQKLAMMFSPLFLIIAALTLSFTGQRTTRLLGFLLGVGAIIIYYILIKILNSIVQNGANPAWLLMQLPNLLFFCFGFLSLGRLNRKI